MRLRCPKGEGVRAPQTARAHQVWRAKQLAEPGLLPQEDHREEAFANGRGQYRVTAALQRFLAGVGSLAGRSAKRPVFNSNDELPSPGGRDAVPLRQVC